MSTYNKCSELGAEIPNEKEKLKSARKSNASIMFGWTSQFD